MRQRVLRWLAVTVVAAQIAPAGAAAEEYAIPRAAFARPDRIAFPAHAPYSPQVATLGKMLFFDPRLSGAQNMSCATCHNPSFGWEAPAPLAIGALNAPLRRHAPTIENLAEATHLFWDGRASSLEEQAVGPITHPQEMAAELDEVIERLSAIGGYRDWFEIVFPNQGLTETTLLRALATYERTLRSGWSPFDDWVAGGEAAISEAAKRGYGLFVDKAACAECHRGWSFTDHDFHDVGLTTDDVGRAEADGYEPDSFYKFKTPGLRNIALRAPYTHNGGIATLADVIDHYADAEVENALRITDLPEIELSRAERDDLLAFLATLTAHDADVATPVLPAE